MIPNKGKIYLNSQEKKEKFKQIMIGAGRRCTIYQDSDYYFWSKSRKYVAHTNDKDFFNMHPNPSILFKDIASYDVNNYNYIFKLPKHKGKSVKWVIDNDPDYIVWIDEYYDKLTVNPKLVEQAKEKLDLSRAEECFPSVGIVKITSEEELEQAVENFNNLGIPCSKFNWAGRICYLSFMKGRNVYWQIRSNPPFFKGGKEYTFNELFQSSIKTTNDEQIDLCTTSHSRSTRSGSEEDYFASQSKPQYVKPTYSEQRDSYYAKRRRATYA